jgi:DNA invertase Pin-like site-specific DNA recombinase
MPHNFVTDSARPAGGRPHGEICHPRELIEPHIRRLAQATRDHIERRSHYSFNPPDSNVRSVRGVPRRPGRPLRAPAGMLGRVVAIAQIAKETGLSRQTIYRIKNDPAGSEEALAIWGLATSKSARSMARKLTAAPE